ncbi:MAG: hypothetical protein JXR60_12305 [Bacteroidales bacterium]|nr:hypothetical protein [Bacteroidales bacterium]
MRTFDDILQEIVDKKNQQIPELTSTSQTAVWWIWANIVAAAIFTFEQIVYTEQAKLEDYSRKQRYGTLLWWPVVMLEFQLGDALEFDNTTGVHSYPVIDETKQIIKKAAIVEVGDGQLIIKVATLDNGLLVPVTQLQSVINYANEIKPAGTTITVLSQNADIINGVAEVYFNGNLLEADIKTKIDEELTKYRDGINVSNTNGVVLRNEIIDVIREIDGIDDVHFTTLTGQAQGGSVNPITREYDTVAGYFNYEPNWIDNWTFTPRFENAVI